MDQNSFRITIPATIQKSSDGQWRIYGLASTQNRDIEGETLNMEGLDLTPIEKGKGLFNFDHKSGPENTVGVVDSYKKSGGQLWLGGYLFKEHDRAKSIYQIMNSLGKSDRGRVGMSVEGSILKRGGKDGKTIEKAKITGCALTMNPINTETYVDLVKSLGASTTDVEIDTERLDADVDLEKSGEKEMERQEVENNEALKFDLDQVADLVAKALSVSNAQATQKPSERSGGDALAQEDLDKKPKSAEHGSEPSKKRTDQNKIVNKDKNKDRNGEQDSTPYPNDLKVKKSEVAFFKSQILDVLEKLRDLYPGVSTATLWETFKDRLNQKFGEQE